MEISSDQESFLSHHDEYGQMSAYLTEHDQDPYNTPDQKKYYSTAIFYIHSHPQSSSKGPSRQYISYFSGRELELLAANLRKFTN
jgi:hypothetical protein